MNDFAPLYSTRERILIALKLLAVAALVYLAGYYWLFPRLRHYAQTANCDVIGGISGLQILVYGLFIGIPLSMALLVWIIEGSRSLRVWKLGQSPLPGEKVLRKTRYRFGAAARLRPAAVFAVVLILIGAAVRGGLQAHALIVEIGPCDPTYSRSRGISSRVQNFRREAAQAGKLVGRAIPEDTPWQFTNAKSAA